MIHKQPLNDSWLFWNPERLAEFPHGSEADHVAQPLTEPLDQDAPEESYGFSLLEDLVVYVAGISAAMVGVALAVLIASFISAYSVLNDAAARNPGVAAMPGHARLEQAADRAGHGGPELPPAALAGWDVPAGGEGGSARVARGLRAHGRAPRKRFGNDRVAAYASNASGG